MRLSICAILLLSSMLCFPQPAAPNLAGDWTFLIEQQGERVIAARVQLSVSDFRLTGKAGNAGIRGSINGSAVDIEWLGQNGNVEATLTEKHEGGRLSGTAKSPDGLTYTWTAERDSIRSAQPRTHEFSPTEFQRRGNPLTGPFYVEGALPGDTLVVRLKRIRTNRDWAQSGAGIVSNAVAPDYTANLKRAQGFSGRWRLDPQSNTASLANAIDALKNFRVPVEPMLGCVAVAPPRQEVVSTRDSGSFGGNMDYNRIREGTAVYLPVFQTWRTAPRWRWTRGAGRWRTHRRCSRDLNGYRVHGGPDPRAIGGYALCG